MHVCRDWQYFCLSCLEAGIPLGIPDDLMQNHSRPGFSYWKHWQTLLNHKETSLKCCPREAAQLINPVKQCAPLWKVTQG